MIVAKSAWLGAASVLVLSAMMATGQVAPVLTHQGKLTVHGTNFSGTARFKFALVNRTGDTTFWSHDGTGVGGGEPSGTSISLTVTRGIYTVNLGDPNLRGMS